MQNQTNFAPMFKIVYRDMYRDLLNSQVKTWDRVKKAESFSWEGETVKWPLRVGRTHAFGAVRPGGPLPEPQHQKTANMQVPLRYYNGRIEIDTPTIKTSKSNRGSYKRALEFEMDNFKVDFIDHMNEVMWGDGRGVWAVVDTVGSGTTTLSVRDPGGIAYGVALNGARFLQPGKRIAILSSDGSTLLCTRRVESYANDGNSVVLNAAVSAAQAPSGGLIVLAPSLTVSDVDDTSYLRDAMGIRGWIDDGTVVNDYFGLNRTTYPITRSSVFSAGALTLDILQQALDVTEQIGQGRPSEHWMHHSTRRAYLQLTVANRTFMQTAGAANFDLGFKGGALDSNPEFSGKPVMVDKDAPYRTWFGIDWTGAIRFPNTDFEWADEDGAVLRALIDVDAYEARNRMYFNQAHDCPNKSFRIDDIDSTVIVAHVL